MPLSIGRTELAAAAVAMVKPRTKEASRSPAFDRFEPREIGWEKMRIRADEASVVIDDSMTLYEGLTVRFRPVSTRSEVGGPLAL